jgi:hypothetical protein
MSGIYELKRSGTQFMWNLKAGNGEIILTSERYHEIGNALSGIRACKENSGSDSRYERRTSSVHGRPYFVLQAGNHEIIGTSEMYSSAAARDNGIESCKVNGPAAETIDKT